MSRLFAAVALFASSALLLAEDWPCWRGPRGDGTSLDKKAPLAFSAEKNVAWKTAIPGIGHSSPVVHGENVFVSTCLEKKGERLLLSLSAKTGKEQWRRTVLTAKLEGKHGLNSHASGTPATDGKHVWVAFMGDGNTMQVACYDIKGQKGWQKSPGKLLSRHGFCTSPILHKNLVLLNGDQDSDGYLVALDKATGKEKWRVDRPNKTRSYCTPVLIPCPKRKGVTQVVLAGSKCVAAYDADTGKLLWQLDGPTEQYVASLVLHQGILFLTTGYPEHHLMGIRPDGSGDITGTKHVAWHIGHRDNGPRGAAYVPSPLAHDGHFYVVSDPGWLGCIEAKTGKRLWLKKLGRRHSASPVLLRGHLILPDDDGKVWVVKASPKFEVVSKNELEEEVYASPAVADGRLFVRTNEHLYCFAEK